MANIVVQRRSGEEYVSIPAGSAVRPGEPIRLFATSLWRADALFEIIDQAGTSLFKQTAQPGLDNAVRMNAIAPWSEGSFIARVSQRALWVFTTEAETTFRVQAQAPEPPPPQPGGGGGLGGALRDTKDLAKWVAIGVVAVIGLQAVGVLKK